MAKRKTKKATTKRTEKNENWLQIKKKRHSSLWSLAYTLCAQFNGNDNNNKMNGNQRIGEPNENRNGEKKTQQTTV